MIQTNWKIAKEYEDITYKKSNGVARKILPIKNRMELQELHLIDLM